MGISEREYAEMLRRNSGPDGISVKSDDGALERNAGALGVEVAAVNPLAARFEALWQRWEGPALEREYKFSAARKWRADYCHTASRTIIELEGGIYSGGRHVRAEGYRSDCEKYNAAAMLGYTVLRLGTGQVDDAHVGEIADWVCRKTKGAR